jgi:serine/threonine-protein kinase PpkA
MDIETGAVVGKYVVERLIGRGRRARVYRVRHRELGVAHALKVFDEPGALGAVRQPELSHPNVVGVLDLLDPIELGGRPALLTELVDGPSLARVLAQGVPALPMLDEIARGVLKGVRVAHLQGLIHGEPTPGNVLLAHAPFPRSDDGVVPRVSDFGLAVAPGLASLAPERLEAGGGEQVDVRTDVYALGVLLYELCAGERPYEVDGLEATEVLELLRSGDAPAVEARLPSLPDRMVFTIGRALALDPADRFGSVDEMLDSWTAVTEATVWHPVLQPGRSEAPPEVAETTETTLVRMDVPPTGDETAPSLPRVAASPATVVPATRSGGVQADWRWPAAAALLGVGVGAGVVAGLGAALFGGGLLLRSQPDLAAEEALVESPSFPSSLTLPDTPAIPPVVVAPHSRVGTPAEEPAAPAGAPASPVPPPTEGGVTLVGDAEGIRLRGPADVLLRTGSSGPVPPGRYRLAVTFPSAEELQLDTVVLVEAGVGVTIDCRRAFFACSVR